MSKKNLRFVKDYNLPINIFDDEMFSYYRKLYKDFWPFEAECLMNKELLKFDGNVDAWLESCSQLRDTIINTLENSEEYIAFNNRDMSEFDIPNIGIGEHSLYNEETDGGLFLSIDLKKANFQALKYVGVLKDDTYEDFIHRFGGSDYFAKSKYLRQVIFGKLNPKRQVKVEKYLVYNIHGIMNGVPGLELYSINSDELVYRCTSLQDLLTEDKLKFLEVLVKEKFNINIRAEIVSIRRLKIVNANGNKVDAFVRTNIYTKEEKLKKASTTFFPQIYKIYKGEEITEKDMIFFFEDQIARFVKPLTLES